MKKYLLILSALLLTSIGANAQSSWTAPGSTLTEGGKYYLYNAEAEQYMGQVNLQWGTEAGFSSTGLLVTLDSSNGTYNIKNGTSYVFFDGTYLYVDGDATKADENFTFTEVGDGTYTIQAVWSTEANNYLGYEGNGSIEIKTTLTSSDSGIYWELVDENTGMDLHNALVILYNTLVHAESYGMTDDDEAYAEAGEVYTSGTATKDEVMEAVAALEEAMEAYASVADPDDVTYAFITNPNFDTGSITGWADTFGYNSASHTNGEITIDGFAESWNGSKLLDKTFYQTLSGLPEGIYRLEVDAIATLQSDASVTVTGVNLYAGSQKTPMHTANGLPEHFTVNFEVADDAETVEIGVEVASTTANWVAVDNFRLYYLGAEYEPGDEVHGCEAEFGHWTISDHTTGLFQHNTWSTEADASGMVNPFIEYWIGSGNVLEDATISHYTITGEPGEIYAVSIDYRAFNENSDKKVSQGSTFTANGTSFDLCVGTRSVFNDVSQEEYAIGYTILCKADETTGAIDVKFDIKDADFDWLAFKDLSIALFDNESWPTLTAAEGDMHTGYADAQSTALAAYNETKSFENYLAAFNAVNAAQLSHLFYSDIAEALTQLEDYLDEAGLAWLEANETILAYEAKTLDYQDMTDVYWGAVKQQTTANTDLTDVLLNTDYLAPYANTGTGYAGTYSYNDGAAVARESFTGKADNGQYTQSDGKIIYQHIDGLVAGATYEIKFYAVANTAWNDGASYGQNIAQVFVNDVTEDITVIAQTSCVPSSYSYTYEVTVGSDGVLEYGIQNVGDGGTWYVLQGVSLTLIDSGEITWEMTEAGWGTLILPFGAEIPSGLTLYAGSTLTIDDSTITVSDEDAATTIAANTPYLVSGAEGTYSFTGAPTNTEDSYTVGMLTGTLVNMTYSDFAADGTEYVLQKHDDEEGLAFYPILDGQSTGVTLNAYHCYLTPGVTPTAVHLPGMATAIEAVESDMIADDAIYDLSGRRVAKAVKGVYIQNGKKVLVK